MSCSKTMCLAMLFVLIHCTSSQVGKENGQGVNGNTLINQEIRGLHYQAHKNRLTYIFDLSSDSETFNILEASQSLLKSQALDAKSFTALIKLYAKACQEVSTAIINQDMGYKRIHEMITGVSISEAASQKIQSDIVDLYAQEEENAEDLISYAYCLKASTSKDAVLLNVVVTGDQDGGL